MQIQLFAQAPKLSSGKLIRKENFPSAFVTSRTIDIWLPDNYSNEKKYAVLYMQDGQMLFDSSQTWNGQEWRMDETMGRLLQEKKIGNCIVVGIWNSGQSRHADYFPQKPVEHFLTNVERDSLYAARRTNGQSVFNGYNIQSDRYLQFVVNELKPFIDSNYSTHRSIKHTFIGGSSMGALISLYAICEYPTVFGGAICLSTHWPGIFKLEQNPFPQAMLKYLDQKWPLPGNHNIYMDIGTRTTDSLYPYLQSRIDSLIVKHRSKTMRCKTAFYNGADHSEKAWATRLHQPLLFILAKPRGVKN